MIETLTKGKKILGYLGRLPDGVYNAFYCVRLDTRVKDFRSWRIKCKRDVLRLIDRCAAATTNAKR